MIDFDYAARQLAGVWAMAWNRPEWRDALDRSVDGVFRSFWAFAFAAPLAFAGYFSLRRAAAVIPDFPETPLLQAPFAFTLAAEMTAYAADWAASLTALIFAARAMKIGRRMADLVVGFNWLQVFVAAAQAVPLIAIGLSGSSDVAGLLFIPATVLVVGLFWGYLRRTFDANVGTTIGLIIMLTLIGLLASAIVSGLATGLLQIFS